MAVPCWWVRRNEADDMVGIGCRLRARGRRYIGIDLTLYFEVGRLVILDVGAAGLNRSNIEHRMSHAGPS